MSERASVRNAGDPDQVRKADRADKRKDDIADRDLQWIMAEAPGRRFVMLLLRGIYDPGLELFAADPYVTAYNVGNLAPLKKLLAHIKLVCPELLLTAQAEAQRQENQDAAERS